MPSRNKTVLLAGAPGAAGNGPVPERAGHDVISLTHRGIWREAAA